MVNRPAATRRNHDAGHCPAKRQRLLLEALEPRNLLSGDSSALADVVAQTQIQAFATHYTAPIGYTPAQIAAAYGFNNIKFGNVVGNGAGQTIAIVDAYDDPDIANDLASFDKQFGLAAPPKFTEVKQTVNGKGPVADQGWALEESLDVEWAHAMAPGASIELIEANTANLGNLLTCIQYAAAQPGVSVVSMSWGASEFNGESSYDSYFTTPAGHTGVSFVASSGDSGAGALWPAISTNVLSVGGTTLTLKNGTYSSETSWSGSSGGTSQYEKEASYEKSVNTTGHQEDPDVSYDANPNTGFAVYDSYGYSGSSGWLEVGGTSAGAPQWSALVAVADQGRALDHENTLTNAAAAVFALPSSDYHDVTSGSNGQYLAGKGYDEVTGLGSPVANLVAQGLVGVTTAQQTYTSIAAQTTTTTTSASATKHVDLGAIDDPTELMFGVAFSQAEAGRPASAHASSPALAGPTASLSAGGGQTASSQSSGLRASGSGGGFATVDGLLDRIDLLTGELVSLDAAGGSAATRMKGADNPATGISLGNEGETLMSFNSSPAGDTQWIDARLAQCVAPHGPQHSDPTALDDYEAQQLDEVLMAVGMAITALWPGDPASTADKRKPAAIC